MMSAASIDPQVRSEEKLSMFFHHYREARRVCVCMCLRARARARVHPTPKTMPPSPASLLVSQMRREVSLESGLSW